MDESEHIDNDIDVSPSFSLGVPYGTKGEAGNSYYSRAYSSTSYSASSNSDSNTSGDVNLIEQAILSSELPESILAKIRGRSRVLVKTVGDLKTYVSTLQSLSLKFSEFPDHKKCISKLLRVTVNRLLEWEKILNKSLKEAENDEEVAVLVHNNESSLKDLVKQLKITKDYQNSQKAKIQGDNSRCHLSLQSISSREEVSGVILQDFKSFENLVYYGNSKFM